jgi:hypothetical protein
MIRQNLVRLNAVNIDGSLRFPGVWVETWAQFSRGVWMLIGLDPLEKYSG